jgi:hypothetical protein
MTVVVVGVTFNCGGGPQTVALRPLRRGLTVDVDVAEGTVTDNDDDDDVVVVVVSNPIHNTASNA